MASVRLPRHRYSERVRTVTEHIERATYTVQEAAARLRVGPQTVYARISDGSWPHTRLTRKISFTEDQIQRILRMSEVAAAPAPAPRRRKAS
jgi:excisionase family DNA binding protein